MEKSLHSFYLVHSFTVSIFTCQTDNNSFACPHNIMTFLSAVHRGLSLAPIGFVYSSINPVGPTNHINILQHVYIELSSRLSDCLSEIWLLVEHIELLLFTQNSNDTNYSVELLYSVGLCVL